VVAFLGRSNDASDEKRRSNRSGEKNRRDGRIATGANERPFDMWLQKQLHAMYDEIASEPLPDDLLGLIDSDAAQAAESKPPADKPGAEKDK
jgi:hypothetical protein